MAKIITPEFRVSFPNVINPKEDMQGKMQYTMTMLFPKETDLSDLKDAVSNAIKERWGEKRPPNLRLPFRDGDEKDLDGYKGHIFINVKSKNKPGLVDEALVPITDENDFYAGCYARASLSVYAYDQSGNRGVSFGLMNVQKLRDGERFSGRSAPQDDFQAVEGAVKRGAAEDFDL